jgi:SAM-dependent methyltransferase
MSFADKFHSALSHPTLYLACQASIGAMRARKKCIHEYVRPRSGLTVLDIGCGPGYTITYFPQPDYYGFDISPQYISYANSRFSKYGHFHCRLFDQVALTFVPPVDVVLLMGLLHHLDDGSAGQLLALAKRAMKPGAQLLTLDGCYSADQSSLARFSLDHDRGQYIRDEPGYLEVASRVFNSVQSTVRKDLFFIPYSSLIMQCRA